MKAVNFVPSTISTIRHERKMLVHNKAGIFRFQKELAIYTCRAVVIMATAPRAERLMVDSGKGKSPFCLPALNVNHHAHRNSISYRSETASNRRQYPQSRAYSVPTEKHSGETGTPGSAGAKYHTTGGKTAQSFLCRTSVSLSFPVF